MQDQGFITDIAIVFRSASSGQNIIYEGRETI